VGNEERAESSGQLAERYIAECGLGIADCEQELAAGTQGLRQLGNWAIRQLSDSAIWQLGS